MSAILEIDVRPRSIDEINVEDYRRQGFLVTRPLFDAETMAVVRRAFERKWHELSADSPQGQVSTSLNNLFPTQLHLEFPELAAFLKHPEFQALCSRMIGNDVDQTWNQGIIKPGQTGGRFAWHQDAHFASTEPMDEGFTCWLAVTRTTVENGTLWIAPEHYGHGVLPHAQDAATGQWTCQFDGKTEPQRKIAVELEPGQLLLFSRFLPHTSGANQTDGVRMAYQIGYGPPGVKLAATGNLFGDQIPLLRNGQAVA